MKLNDMLCTTTMLLEEEESRKIPRIHHLLKFLAASDSKVCDENIS